VLTLIPTRTGAGDANQRHRPRLGIHISSLAVHAELRRVHAVTNWTGPAKAVTRSTGTRRMRSAWRRRCGTKLDAVMTNRAWLPFGGLMVGVVMAAGAHGSPAAVQPPARGTGTINGHIRLTGKPPGNPVIRMGMDPKCSQINAGKRVMQENVVASLDGSLANVFLGLQGPFSLYRSSMLSPVRRPFVLFVGTVCRAMGKSPGPLRALPLSDVLDARHGQATDGRGEGSSSTLAKRT
jgi:hypothetical protein